MDSDFFANIRKGEISQLRIQLQNRRDEVKVGAMRRILATMLSGTDMDCLFANVLNCAQTNYPKLKKLVYYYLSDTALRQPDLAMLAVNTLSRDFSSQSPLVRTLALRTVVGMGVASLTQHLVASLQQCLFDDNPYVRKTAALSVARLNMMQSGWVEDIGFEDRLKDMLSSDCNAAVVANVVAALMEIGQLQLDFVTVNKLLNALNECHEWGQVSILEAISTYQPIIPWEVRTICERITPFLAHCNAAVILTSVRILLPLIELLPSEELQNATKTKLSAPLKSLLSSEPEIQYITLRNIQLVLQKYPDLIRKDFRLFFIKYYDPIYVKLEKLNVIVRLSGAENMTEILSELREYAGEADVELVRNAILAIGRCALKLEIAADRCVKTLLNLIETDVSYIIESVIIAFRDIFRRYPKRYEQAINALSNRLERLEDSEARSAFIWMLGEYARYITDVETLLDVYVDDFQDEVATVQLATLTAVVKAFLTQPTSPYLVQKVLTKAVAVSNPDLRDRAFIYWRLLSTDPVLAQTVVLAEKPPIIACVDDLSPSLLDCLLSQIGTLASIFYKLPSEVEVVSGETLFLSIRENE